MRLLFENMLSEQARLISEFRAYIWQHKFASGLTSTPAVLVLYKRSSLLCVDGQSNIWTKRYEIITS